MTDQASSGPAAKSSGGWLAGVRGGAFAVKPPPNKPMEPTGAPHPRLIDSRYAALHRLRGSWISR